MKLWIERYSAMIRAAWMVDLQYRADITLFLLWGITEPAVALGIWWSIAKQSGGEVDGFSGPAFVQYFFAITLVNQLTQAWDAWNIEQWIAEGEMNHRLARPLSPIHEAIADNLAYKARTATLVLIVWIGVSLVWPAARLPYRPRHIALAAIAIVLGAAIRFLNNFTVGLLGFWTTRATALVELQMAVGMFLSGQLAPLDLLPERVRVFAHLLWFPYMIAFPASLLVGTGDSATSPIEGFTGQIVWLLAWVLAYRWTWRRGRERYGAVGG
jgi:ABC-2 type transport system permease protein